MHANKPETKPMHFFMCVECGAEYQTLGVMPIYRRCDAESDEGELCRGYLDELPSEVQAEQKS